MLKIYDKEHNTVGYIVKYRDLKIESDVTTGDRILSFTYLAKKHQIEEEYYVETEDDEYVIKEKSVSTDGFLQFTANLNLEELEAKPWESFSVEEKTIEEAAKLALAGSGWTVGESTVKKKRNAGILQTNTLGILRKLCTAFICEISFDTKKKTVSFYEQIGNEKGTFFLNGLNMRKLQRRGSTYDYYTRIIPIGAEGMTIENVNNGKKYVENYQYSNKVKTYIWKDESYTDAEALKEDAEKKLQDMSKPEVSYSVDVIDLAKQKKYKSLKFDIGDTVTLIDAKTGIREKQRIVKMVRYPENSEKDSCELANRQPSFEEMRQKLQEAQEIIDAVINDDGRYTGTIKVSDILKFEEGVASSNAVGGLQESYNALDESYSSLKLAIGEIKTNYLLAEEAEIEYAKIDFTNITEASMEHFFAASGLIENVSITNAQISGELVGVKIKGELIEAETIVANKLIMNGTDGLYHKMNTSGEKKEEEQTGENSLNGQIIAGKSITASKIDVEDLTAFGATIGGFHIAEDAIYSGVKESVFNPTSGLYMDKKGQLSFGDNEKYLRYYIDENEKRHLDVSADNFFFSSTGKSVENTIRDDIDSIEIGGRNLIRNSMTLIFKDYYFSEEFEINGACLADENGYMLLDEKDCILII